MALPALAHQAHFTPAENDWMNRQFSVGGPLGADGLQHPSPVKCCDQRDIHVGLAVTWRMRAGGYEVQIDGTWHRVPPDRLMRHRADDPTPFPGEALLFYSPSSVGPRIWCFFPEPLT